MALFPLEDLQGPDRRRSVRRGLLFRGCRPVLGIAERRHRRQAGGLAGRGLERRAVLEVGEHFNSWELEKTPKTKGGHVFITVSHRGAVEIHDGWLSQEGGPPRGQATGQDTPSPPRKARSQITKTMENYLELHRHALVRLALIADPGVALRLMVAHAAAPSGNWQVKSDPQRSAQRRCERQHRACARTGRVQGRARSSDRHLLGLAEDAKTEDVFARLLTLSDAEVLRVAALVMADTLAVGSASVDAAGTHLQVDARTHWQPDEAFFELARDRATVNAMLAEIGGPAVAKANVAEKAKTQKKIIRDFLAGANGREKVEGWCPGWMAFPFRQLGEKPRAPKAKAEIAPERLAAE